MMEDEKRNVIAEYHYELFADYHQFYLQDEQASGDLSESWTQQESDILLAVAPGVVGVGTARNMTVPVTVQILDGPPAEDARDWEQWDRINECSMEIASGSIVVAGCTDYLPEAARIKVAPGWYRLRIYYGGLHTLTEDGLDGDDHYKIALWPATQAGLQILKQPNA